MSEPLFSSEEIIQLIERAEMSVKLDNIQSAMTYPSIGPSLRAASDSAELVGLKIRQFMYESMTNKRDLERRLQRIRN